MWYLAGKDGSCRETGTEIRRFRNSDRKVRKMPETGKWRVLTLVNTPTTLPTSPHTRHLRTRWSHFALSVVTYLSHGRFVSVKTQPVLAGRGLVNLSGSVVSASLALKTTTTTTRRRKRHDDDVWAENKQRWPAAAGSLARVSLQRRRLAVAGANTRHDARRPDPLRRRPLGYEDMRRRNRDLSLLIFASGGRPAH